VTKELGQIHYQNMFQPVDPSTLSKKEMEHVIESHLFLKPKHDTTIKGRTVAGRDKQHGYISKEEATSPTASLELVLLTAIIDVQEGHDVAICNVPNAFIQTQLTDDKDKLVMQLQGPLATLLVDLAPEVYGPYLKEDKHGHPVLYMRILNAMYGIMRVALLYYQHFVANICSIGFELNPYDPCVANKLVNSNQLTLIWHVDDIKASHCNKEVITNYIEWLRETYECIFEDGSGALKISCGLMHEHLGMQLDFSVPGKLKLSMVPYIEAMLAEFYNHDKTSTTAKTLAALYLFQVNNEATLLPENAAAVFHTFMAKALFLTKHTHPDLATAVAFLSTCVTCPDQDDWKKLRCMM